MASEWYDCTTGQYEVIDAVGETVQLVEAARRTADGVEVIVLCATPEGEPYLASHDEGVTFDPVRARFEIPNGELFDLEA